MNDLAIIHTESLRRVYRTTTGIIRWKRKDIVELAFLLMTLTLDSSVSLLVCLGLWLLQNVGRLVPSLRLPFPFPDVATATARPWLWLLTILLVAAALWLGRSEEHWLRKQA